MTRPITFTVAGDPVPQPRPRVSTRGGFARAYVPARHPVHAYRQAVADAAKAAGVTVSDDAVSVELTFLFERPKSHKNKRGLKKDAPSLPPPDVDNLAKAALDSLTCVAWHDDRQVARLVVSKGYASESATLVRLQ
jgi:Holliday junction resolvase RusA-like endonuclease